MSNEAEKQTGKLKRTAVYIVGGAVVLVCAIAGYRRYQVHVEADRLEAEAKAGPHIEVVEAKKSPPSRTLSLVGEATPYASVTLYAKVSGYLKAVKVDKGDKVKKDQLLAIIESPEIDKDYQGALADARNKKAIAGRMTQLRARNLVSPQEADQAESDNEVAQAKLDSLAVQKGYEILRAPFEGTVTSRYVDPGALVQNAANSQTSAQPVVTVSQVDKLRVYVYVDQRDASYILPGSPAKVTVEERPELELKAVISRVSGELDPKTKLLLTEVDVDNKQQQLVPGSFVQVTLVIHTPELLELPVQALMMRDGKSMLGVVDKDDVIHFREFRSGENNGQYFTVLSGLQEGERVGLNVGSNLPDNSHVRPNESKPAAPAPAPAATAAQPATSPAPASETPAPKKAAEAEKSESK